MCVPSPRPTCPPRRQPTCAASPSHPIPSQLPQSSHGGHTLTSPKTASGPQRIFFVFWVKPWEAEERCEAPLGLCPALPRPQQTLPCLPASLPPGSPPTSEAELHLPLAAARQVGEPPDADAERHRAEGRQHRPPAVTQSRLARPVRQPAPSRCPTGTPQGRLRAHGGPPAPALGYG